jgi:hypothetical protein
MTESWRDRLFKLFWTLANVALAAATVEVAGWDQGVLTIAALAIIQVASTVVRDRVAQPA